MKLNIKKIKIMAPEMGNREIIKTTLDKTSDMGYIYFKHIKPGEATNQKIINCLVLDYNNKAQLLGIEIIHPHKHELTI